MAGGYLKISSCESIFIATLIGIFVVITMSVTAIGSSNSRRLSAVLPVASAADKTIIITAAQAARPEVTTINALLEEEGEADFERNWRPSSYASMMMALTRVEENAISNTPSNFNKNPLQQRRDEHAQRGQSNAAQTQSPLAVYADAATHLVARPRPAMPKSSSSASGHVDNVSAARIVAADTSIGDDTRVGVAAAANDEYERLQKSVVKCEGVGEGIDFSATATSSAIAARGHAAVADNVAALSQRNGFRDKINISNQRNEFYGQRTKTTAIMTQHHHNGKDSETLPASVRATTTKLKRAVNSDNKEHEHHSHNQAKVATAKDEPHFMLTPDKRQQQKHQQKSLSRTTTPTPSGDDAPERQHELLVLHRRKRYLLFPESSSFQMIFDLIIPIVDWTNFAIMGITCAVAWELPSKPPSEIFETLSDRLKDGTLGLSRRNDSVDATNEAAQLQYVDTQPTAATTNAYQSAQTARQQQQQPNWQYNAYNKDYNYNYNNNNKWSQYEQREFKTPHDHSWRIRPNTWLAKQQRWQQQQQQQQQNGRTQSQPKYAQRRRKPLKAPPQHRVYAVYPAQQQRPELWTRPRRNVADDGGRAATAAEVAAKMERIHLREHLMTRQKLYDKIEKLYKTRGHNGTACVLRALCETSQRAAAAALPQQKPSYKRQQQHHQPHQHQAEPQSFITELLRAIFTLPTVDEAAAEATPFKHNNRTTRTTEHQRQQLIMEHIAPHYRQAHLHGQQAAAVSAAAAAVNKNNKRSARDAVQATVDCTAIYGHHCGMSIWQSDAGAHFDF